MPLGIWLIAKSVCLPGFSEEFFNHRPGRCRIKGSCLPPWRPDQAAAGPGPPPVERPPGRAPAAVTARLPPLERGVGADRLARWHAMGGRYTVCLVVPHATLIVWGYAVTAHTNVV